MTVKAVVWWVGLVSVWMASLTTPGWPEFAAAGSRLVSASRSPPEPGERSTCGRLCARPGCVAGGGCRDGVREHDQGVIAGCGEGVEEG